MTVLLHPGRVKSGLVASATRGPVLGSGERIVLKLDGKTVKQWRVREADRQGAQPEAWRIGSVAAGTRTALIVELDDEVDHTAVALIAVLDQGMRRVA
ncbi:hypothetical protein LP420_04630 [Massilia sp. B-10]|nr:hypothetical protein LP420_04630 [Massilia sp. B-10]